MALSSSSSSSISSSMATASGGAGSSSSFYESIYHLKKMFPKLDLEIIESVLRSNNDNMAESIDHLLAMSIDDSCNIVEMNNSAKFREVQREVEKEQVWSNHVNLSDQPPSYYELMRKFSNSNHTSTVDAYDDNDDDRVSISTTATIKRAKDDRILNKLNSVLVGNLPRDFLRVKLNNEQLRAVRKCDEYKDKYQKSSSSNKLKSHHYDDLDSRLMMNDDSIRRTYADNCESLRSFQDIHVNSRDIDLKQDVEDEYLAILLQNEEFLNYLKTDNDFISTLNDEIVPDNHGQNVNNKKIDIDYKPHKDADYGYGSDKFDDLMNNNINFINSKYALATLSNDEFKMRLFRMGRASQLRFLRLARVFAKKFKLHRFNRFLNPQQNNMLALNNENYKLPSNVDREKRESNSNSRSKYDYNY